MTNEEAAINELNASYDSGIAISKATRDLAIAALSQQSQSEEAIDSDSAIKCLDVLRRAEQIALSESSGWPISKEDREANILALTNAIMDRQAWKAVAEINGIEKPGVPIEFMAVGENQFKARLCCVPEIVGFGPTPAAAILAAKEKTK